MRFRSVQCGMPGSDAIANAIDYAKFYSRSHDALVRVYDESGNVIETHEQAGDFSRDRAISACWLLHDPDNEEFMLSFYREALLSKRRNRRNRLSSNCS